MNAIQVFCPSCGGPIHAEPGTPIECGECGQRVLIEQAEEQPIAPPQISSSPVEQRNPGKQLSWARRNQTWIVAIGIVTGMVALAILIMPLANFKGSQMTPEQRSQVFKALFQGIAGIAMLFFAIWVYFLPSSIASSRKHPQSQAISILNLFLGWTFLGWVLALVWAHTAGTDPREQRIKNAQVH